jgi:hypothetical protein
MDGLDPLSPETQAALARYAQSDAPPRAGGLRVDPGGQALRLIKALAERVAELEARVEVLEARR